MDCSLFHAARLIARHPPLTRRRGKSFEEFFEASQFLDSDGQPDMTWPI
jgi:hypothetical protein